MKKRAFVTLGLSLGLTLAGASVALGAGWQIGEGGRYWYENEDGSYAKGMRQIDGKTYIFDDNGYMKTGWDYYNWCYYYMDGSGAVQTGWVFVDGKWYYMNAEGVMQVGFITLDKDIYFLDYNTGAMVTGSFEFDGYRYQAGSDGKIIRSKKDGNVRYDKEGRISYYNSETKDWDYMPDKSDIVDTITRGLSNKYEQGKYYTNQSFESDAYQNLKDYMTEEEIAEFISQTEDLYDDIYQRNEDRYYY